MRPHRRKPTRLPRPWDSPGKNTGVGCHFLLQCMKVKSEMEVAQSCPTLSDPMDYSPPGSSIHGIFQARVLEWGAIAFSDREAIESQIGPTSICDPAVSPYFHVYLVFLHKHFPLWIPPSGPLGLSPHSQQQILPKDCSPISMPQLPVTALSRGLASLSRVHVATTRLLVWFSFHSDCQYPQMLHFCLS